MCDLLPAETIGKPSSGKHSHGLGHFCKALPVRHNLGADGRLSINCGVIHLIDERLHRDDIARNLLLELFGCQNESM